MAPLLTLPAVDFERSDVTTSGQGPTYAIFAPLSPRGRGAGGEGAMAPLLTLPAVDFERSAVTTSGQGPTYAIFTPLSPRGRGAGGEEARHCTL